MGLTPIPITDTRHFFRPLAARALELARALDASSWARPTLAPEWRVRDVFTHMVDTALRRVSFHRDRLDPPRPSVAIRSERDFVAFINRLNAEWVNVTKRFSPAVLIGLYNLASTELADFVERLPIDAPPLFPVSWAGEDGDQGWLDIGRDFTEQWHHQMQIREAVGARQDDRTEWLHATLLIALRGLPHTYRHTPAAERTTVVIEILGPAGGLWTLQQQEQRWTLWAGTGESDCSARVAMTDDVAWRLLFNALPGSRLEEIHTEGDRALVAPLFAARSVVVK